MSVNKINYHIVIFLVALPFLFNWIGYHDFLSSPLSITITAVLLTISLLLSIQKKMQVCDLIYFLLLIVSLAIPAILYNSLGTVLTCYNIFVMAFLFNNIEFEKKQLQTVHLLLAILLVVFMAKMDFPPSYGTYRVYQSNGLEININSFGILALALYYHLLNLLYSLLPKRLRPLLLLCATSVAIYLIEISQCRSAYLSLVSFLFLHFFKRLDMRYYKKLLFFSVFIAIIFPFLYLQLADVLEGLNLGGKSLLSRKYVWTSAVELIKQYPIFGSGTLYDMKINVGDAYSTSAHNVFLGLWKTVGFLPMILFGLRLCKGKNIDAISQPNIMRKKMFLSCIALCIFETLLNDSNTSIFFMTLLLTEYNEEEQNQ